MTDRLAEIEQALALGQDPTREEACWLLSEVRRLTEENAELRRRLPPPPYPDWARVG